MKITLSTGIEFPVSTIFKQDEAQLCIGFTGIKSYDELRKALTVEALATIKYYQEDASKVFTTYEDYINVIKASTVESEDGTLDIAIYLEKTDKIQKELQTLKQEISALKEENQNLQKKVDTIITASATNQ
jgi:predicted ribosome quality control (RQC) complex YloA/Tae2 family protein